MLDVFAHESHPYPEEAMAGVYRAAYVTLHVRKSNRAALSLYKDNLGYRIHETEKAYCELLTVDTGEHRLPRLTYTPFQISRCGRRGCVRDAMCLEAFQPLMPDHNNSYMESPLSVISTRCR